MNNKLGISIPTYRRPEQLKRCLLSVIRSAREHEVPVFVLDDSGDDTNRAVLAEMQEQYPLIHAIRNEQNLGIDRNILASVDACPCDYAWMLGEDDRLVPDAVGRMLGILENSPAFVFVNYATVNDAVDVVLREQALPMKENQTLPADEFLARHGWAPGFIGGCVVNKACWAASPAEPYLDTWFAHVGRIFHGMEKSFPQYGKNGEAGREWAEVLLVADSLVLNRCGSPETFSWQSKTFEVLGGWARLMQKLQPLYGEAICERSLESFEAAHGLNSLKFLLYVRAGGAYGVEEYNGFIRPRHRGAIYKAGAWVIARCNRKLIHLAHRLLAKVRHQRGRRIEGY